MATIQYKGQLAGGSGLMEHFIELRVPPVPKGSGPGPSTKEIEGTMRVLLGILILGVCCIVYAQMPLQPFTISLSAGNAEVKSGDPVYLNIVMTNTSENEVDCTGSGRNGLDRNYFYDVLYEGGKPATKVVKKHPEIGENLNIWPCTLKPGETAPAAGGEISALYDFSRPGKYSIRASRHITRDANCGIINSNTITIAVLSTDHSDLAPEKRMTGCPMSGFSDMGFNGTRLLPENGKFGRLQKISTPRATIRKG